MDMSARYPWYNTAESKRLKNYQKKHTKCHEKITIRQYEHKTKQKTEMWNYMKWNDVNQNCIVANIIRY